MTSGPMVKSRSENCWYKDLVKLFSACGLDHSSHSIQGSAAQWARRCDADLVVIRSVGRWVSFKSVMYYIAEGEKISRGLLCENNNVDPVLSIWLFDTDSMWDTMDKGSSDRIF